MEEAKQNEKGNSEIRKAEILAAGDAVKAIFLPMPGLKRGNLS